MTRVVLSHALRSALASALCVGLGASCVQLAWSRATLQEPLSDAKWRSATPGSSLSDCLALLGAPYFVWEQPGGAIAIAYAWSSTSGWGFGVSAPIGRHANASFDFDALSSDTQGLALWFDSDWKLVRLQRGALRDLAEAPARARPAFVQPRAPETKSE